MSRMMTTTEVSQHVGISKATLYTLIRTGRAPAYHRIGSKYLFRMEDVDRWIRASRVEPTSPTTAEPRHTERAAM